MQLTLFEADKFCVGTTIYQVGATFGKLTITSLSAPFTNYFTAKDKDGNVCYLSSKARGMWWDYTKDAAKKCSMYLESNK